jgi:hypothetical protein
MDTTTLMVGQDVVAGDGLVGRKGKVVEVTSSGVVVQFGVMQNDGTWNPHERKRFDSDGKACDNDDPMRGPWELSLE